MKSNFTNSVGNCGEIKTTSKALNGAGPFAKGRVSHAGESKPMPKIPVPKGAPPKWK